MFDVNRIKSFLDFAKVGDINSILGLSAEVDTKIFLERNPEFQKNSFKWERLIALYFAQEITGQESLSDIIYNFAEFDIFRYDDNGYVLMDLNIDITAIKSSQIFGLFEPNDALEIWKRLIEGGKFQVQCRFHELADLLDPSIRSELKNLVFGVVMGISDLITLLGESIDDPRLVQHFMNHGIEGPPTFREGFAFIAFCEQGYDLCFQIDKGNRAVLTSIQIFPKGDDRHRPYTGDLPFGVQTTNKLGDLISRLGSPAEQNHDFDHAVWYFPAAILCVSYDETNFSIVEIQYNKP